MPWSPAHLLHRAASLGNPTPRASAHLPPLPASSTCQRSPVPPRSSLFPALPGSLRASPRSSLRLRAADSPVPPSPPPMDPTPAPPATTAPIPAPAPVPLLQDPRVSLALHVSCGALVASTFFNRSLFGYHPTLMALSFLLFMPEAILSAVRGTGKARKAALSRHAYLNAASFAAALAGLFAIWLNKERNSKPHLVSLHAALGAVAFLGSSLIATGGVPILYGFPQFLRKGGLPKAVISAHKKVGTVAYALGSVVCILGLQTFRPAHPLHKGAVTYLLAGLIAASVGLVLLNIQGKQKKAKAK